MLHRTLIGNQTSQLKRKSLFINGSFTRLFLAYAAGTFGDWFDSLAIVALVAYKWQASPITLALIPVSLALPGALLGSVAGAYADRLDKLKLMRIAELATAALTLCLLLAPHVFGLLPLLLLRSVVATVTIPSQQALTRSIVPESQLLQAASLNGLVSQGAKVAGPLLGGTALLVLSPGWCIAVNAFMRLLSYVLLVSIKLPQNQDAKKTVPKEITDDPAEPNYSKLFSAAEFIELWHEGWSYLLKSRVLLSLMLYAFVGSSIIQIIDFQFASLFRELDPIKNYLMSYFIAAAGAGAVAVMLLARKSTGTFYSWKLGGGYVLIALSIEGLAMLRQAATPILVLGCGFLLGVGNGIFFLTFNYALQKETPAGITGRIFGIQNTMLSTVQIVAPLLGGIFVQTAGVRPTFLSSGIVLAAVGLAGLGWGCRVWLKAVSSAAGGHGFNRRKKQEHRSSNQNSSSP